MAPLLPSTPNTGKSQTKSEKRSGNTLYQELAFQDVDPGIVEGEDGDITGKTYLYSTDLKLPRVQRNYIIVCVPIITK